MWTRMLQDFHDSGSLRHDSVPRYCSVTKLKSFRPELHTHTRLGAKRLYCQLPLDMWRFLFEVVLTTFAGKERPSTNDPFNPQRTLWYVMTVVVR